MFMAAYDQSIVLVNVDNPPLSEIAFQYSGYDFFGITASFVNCDSIVILASGSDGKIYNIDISGQTISEFSCPANVFTSGLATPNEWQSNSCEFSIDLDGDDSSGALGEVAAGGHLAIACTLPVGVAGTDVSISAGPLIDSVVLQLLGPPDGAAEYLSSSASYPGIVAVGSGSGHLRLQNSGTAGAADFEAAVAGARYHNDAGSPTPGTRLVEVTMWGQGGALQREVVSQVNFLSDGPLSFSLGNDTLLCPGASLSLSIPYEYYHAYETPGDTLYFGAITWQDGSTGNSLVAGAAGAYACSFVFEEAQGCAWADTVLVEQGDTVLTYSTVELCSGAAYSVGGQVFVTDTLVCEQGVSAQGCDSTHCTAIVFLPPPQATLVGAAICQGSLYDLNGQLYGSPGTYADTLAGWDGCDSLVLLELEVLPADTTLLTAELCPGGQYQVGGQVFSATGTYEVVLTGAGGCDSLVVLDLFVHGQDTAQLSATICEGMAYELGGQQFVAGGTYPVALQASNGCDSTVLLSLTVLPPPAVSIAQSADPCGILPTLLVAQSPAASGYVWSSGGTAQAEQAAATGSYSVTVTDLNGCTGTGGTAAVLATPVSAVVENAGPLCFGGTDGHIAVTGTAGGTPPYVFALNGGVPSPDAFFDGLGSGGHLLTVLDAQGCAFTTTVVLEAPAPASIDAGPDRVIGYGDELVLEAAVSAQIDSVWWTPGSGLSCGTCAQTTASPSEAVVYRVFAITSEGCLVSDTVFVDVRFDLGELAYAPNVFSPNGDGINDHFTIFPNPTAVVETASFRVFNRWGAMLFERHPYLPAEAGWDGTFQGKDVGQGVYVWFAEVVLREGERRLLKGEVTVVR